MNGSTELPTSKQGTGFILPLVGDAPQNGHGLLVIAAEGDSPEKSATLNHEHLG